MTTRSQSKGTQYSIIQSPVPSTSQSPVPSTQSLPGKTKNLGDSLAKFAFTGGETLGINSVEDLPFKIFPFLS